MTNVTEEEALRVTVLEWLSDSGHLQRLEEQCGEYRGEEKVAFFVCVFLFLFFYSHLLH